MFTTATTTCTQQIDGGDSDGKASGKAKSAHYKWKSWSPHAEWARRPTTVARAPTVMSTCAGGKMGWGGEGHTCAANAVKGMPCVWCRCHNS